MTPPHSRGAARRHGLTRLLLALPLLSPPALASPQDLPSRPGVPVLTEEEVTLQSTGEGFRKEGTGEVVPLVPPVLEVASPAPYPEALRGQPIGGTVQLELRVGADGSVEEAHVVTRAHPQLDEAALQAARSLRFRPALLGGQPTAVRIHYAYHFEAPAAPQEATLVGQVRSRGNRRPVAGARVAVAGTDLGVTTDGEGRFTLPLPPGALRMEVQAPGYEAATFPETVHAGQQLEVRYALTPTVLDPYETVVRGEKERTEVSRVSLHAQELREVPGTMGDPFRVVMLMPGVASIASGISYPVVRGAQPAATGFFLDGVRVPALFHAALGPSVIHPDFMEGLDFYAGAPPVRFGRLLSGAVEGQVRRPRGEGLRASASVDLINAGALVEQAFPGTGTSVTLAGRFSYTGWLLTRMVQASQHAPPEADMPRPVADFADYQGRIEQRLGPGRLRLLAFGSSDVLGSRTETREAALALSVFHRADLRWRQPLGSGELEAGLTWGVQRLGMELFAGFPEGERSVQRRVADYVLRDNTLSARLLWSGSLTPALGLSAGADLGHQRAHSSLWDGFQETPADVEGAGLRRERALGTLGGAFLQATWKPTPGWTLVPGLRLDSYHLAGDTTRLALDPRLTVRHALGDTLTLKGGAALLHQAPTVLLQMPVMDVAGLGYGLQEAAQVDAGLEWAPLPGLELGVDAYASVLTRAVEFDPTDLLYDRRRVIGGRDPGRPGRAWGIEVMARHPLGERWFGWLSYSYQRSERWERFLRLEDDPTRFELREGWLPFAFEQQHVLNAAVSYQLPGNISLGAALHANTGRPESGRISSRTHRQVVDPGTGEERWVPVSRDQVDRLPPFVRVDLRAAKTWTFDSWALELYLDVMNASFSREVYGFDYVREPENPLGQWGPETPLVAKKKPYGFPVVLPMLGLKGSY